MNRTEVLDIASSTTKVTSVNVNFNESATTGQGSRLR